MIYLNTSDILICGKDWVRTTQVIENTVKIVRDGDYEQPIKPYLRYHNPSNRIIAMPAYVGGNILAAGMKWIASFPGNRKLGMNRAHSVTILNDVPTGRVIATIHSMLISGIRTASVSGLLIQHYDRVRPLEACTVGIIGFGPIGQLHLEMLWSLFDSKVSSYIIYDIAGVPASSIPENIKHKVIIATHWEEAYVDVDMVITCTVSEQRYIDKAPKPGSLLLNVSLRDYTTDILNYTSSIIVDNWEEVCRENTDIEVMSRERGLCKANTKSIEDIVCGGQMSHFPKYDPILVNPMGMAVFDIAIGAYYYNEAISHGVGLQLED